MSAVLRPIEPHVAMVCKRHREFPGLDQALEHCRGFCAYPDPMPANCSDEFRTGWFDGEQDAELILEARADAVRERDE